LEEAITWDSSPRLLTLLNGQLLNKFLTKFHVTQLAYILFLPNPYTSIYVLLEDITQNNYVYIKRDFGRNVSIGEVCHHIITLAEVLRHRTEQLSRAQINLPYFSDDSKVLVSKQALQLLKIFLHT
jgi:hypothetical protein